MQMEIFIINVIKKAKGVKNMPRAIIGITTLLVVLLVGTGIAYWAVIDSAEGLLDLLTKLETKVEAEEWQAAKQAAKALENRWEEKVEMLWTPLLDHTQINELENSFTRLMRLVKLESKDDALAELAVSKRLVQNVPNTERVSFKNVF